LTNSHTRPHHPNSPAPTPNQPNRPHPQVGPTDHAICALSGGVDSTVAATLIHKVLGDRLHCVFVDHGLLRYKEGERVMETFTQHLHLPVTMVDDSVKMLAKLKGVSDPEAKRKAIGGHFIEVFNEYANKLERELGIKPKFLVQVRGSFCYEGAGRGMLLSCVVKGFRY